MSKFKKSMNSETITKLYNIAAMVVFILISISAYTAYRSTGAFSSHLIVNDRWVNEINSYNELSKVVVLSSAPANDVTDSKSIELSLDSLESLVSQQQSIMKKLKVFASSNNSFIRKGTVVRLEAKLNKANNDAKIGIFNYGKGNTELAHKYISAMNSTYTEILTDIQEIKRALILQQKSIIYGHESDSQTTYAIELGVLVLALAVLFAMLFINKLIGSNNSKLLEDLEDSRCAVEYRENELENILKSILESVITINSKGIIEYVNDSTLRIFGYTREELIGCNIDMLMPEEYVKTNIKKITTRNLKGKHRGGNIFPIEISLTEIEKQDQKRFIGVIRDLTNVKRSEKHASVIVKIQDMFINNADMETISREVLKFILDYIDSEYGFIAIIKDDEIDMYASTSISLGVAHGREIRFEKSTQKKVDLQNMKNCLISRTVVGDTGVILNDITEDMGDLLLGAPKLERYIGIPVYGSNNENVAIIGIANKSVAYDDRDVDDIKSVAIIISSIVEVSILRHKMSQMVARDS